LIVVFTSRLIYITGFRKLFERLVIIRGKTMTSDISSKYHFHRALPTNMLPQCFRYAYRDFECGRPDITMSAWALGNTLSGSVIDSFEISANKIQCSPKEKSYVNPKFPDATNSTKRWRRQIYNHGGLTFMSDNRAFNLKFKGYTFSGRSLFSKSIQGLLSFHSRASVQ